MIPFSAIELSIAVNFGSLTKEEAIFEMENHMGFSLDAPSEYSFVYEYLSGCQDCGK